MNTRDMLTFIFAISGLAMVVGCASCLISWDPAPIGIIVLGGIGIATSTAAMWALDEKCGGLK